MDLKPDNILIKRSGSDIECKVSDFGICQSVETDPDQYSKLSGGLISKWAASPEVLKE